MRYKSLAERKNNSELASGISELSNLMRYMLYDCKADRVSLEKELTFLRSIIEIHGLKISDEDEIVLAFDVRGNYEGKKIAPLILVPFVENAFKHGVKEATQTIPIDIQLEKQGNELIFEVKNKVPVQSELDQSSQNGLGLKNLGRRLDLLYPQKHNLRIQLKEDVFCAQLKLKLDD